VREWVEEREQERERERESEKERERESERKREIGLGVEGAKHPGRRHASLSSALCARECLCVYV